MFFNINILVLNVIKKMLRSLEDGGGRGAQHVEAASNNEFYGPSRHFAIARSVAFDQGQGVH